MCKTDVSFLVFISVFKQQLWMGQLWPAAKNMLYSEWVILTYYFLKIATVP